MAALRRITRIVFIVLASIAGLLVIALLVLQTPWAKNYLRGVVERQAEAALGVEVSIGSLGGPLLSGAELQNLRISHQGQPIVTVPEVDVGYSLLDLLTGDVDISSVVLREPVIHLRRMDGGTLNLAALGAAGADDTAATTAGGTPRPGSTRGVDPVPGPEGLGGDSEATGEPGRGWSIGEIAIDEGTLTIGDRVVTSGAVNAPERLENFDTRMAIASRPEGGLRLDIDRLSFQAVSPDLQVRSAEGEIVFGSATLRFGDVSLQTNAGVLTLSGAITNRETTPVYDLRIATENLALPALAPFVPALDGYDLSPTIQASLEGPASAVRAQFDVRTQAGALGGDLTLNLTEPEQAVAGTLRTRNLNLGAFQIDEQTDITMAANVDLQIPKSGLSGLSGTYDLEAPTFQYGQYNAQNVEASGRIEEGRIRVDANAALYGGTLQTQGTITLPSGGQPIQYDLEGKLRDVDPSQLPSAIRPPGVSGRGGAPRDLPQQARLRPVGLAAAPARAVPQAGRQGIDLDFRVRGRGSDIEADATLIDVSIAGADFGENTSIDVSREGGRLQYSAEGSVTGLDLRRLGRELGMEGLTAERFASDIDAQFDITGSGTELSDLTLRGTATLTDSELFGARFRKLVVNPDLTRGSGTIALDGAFEGLDLGAVAGNPALESRLQGTIDARVALDGLANPDFSLGALEASGRLTLADSRVSGVPIERAVVDATVSEAVARVRELTITGPDLDVDISGSLALDETGSSDLTYLIDTPALQRFDSLGVPARGDVLIQGRVEGNFASLRTEGTLSGTQVSYGDISMLSVNSDYDVVIPNLTFAEAHVSAVTDASQLEAAGRSFSSVKARTAYGGTTLEFDTAVVDSGRTLEAEGRLLLHTDHQEVHLRRFSLKTPDASWALTGVEDAVIDYSGEAVTVSDLVLASKAGGRIVVEGSLGSAESVLTATIDGLQLDSIDDIILEEEPLSGLVNVTATVSGTFSEPVVEARLEVLDGAYRGFEYERVSGTVGYTSQLVRLDVRIDQSDDVALMAEGLVPLSETTGEALRVNVSSTPIDLALVQTFTDELQQVDGTAEVDVIVRGSLSKPQLDGTVRVRDGAFTVVLAQSRYSNFETDILFDGGLITVTDFQLRDDEGNVLRIGGQLALDGEREPGVNIRIESENFEMADNRLAEMNVSTDLQVTGELMRPRIQGRVALGDSLLRVDRILQLTTGAYEVAPADEEPAEEPGMFAPTVDIDLSIPESLVIRGTDVQAPGGGTIGLGNVNITIAGNLQIRMAPGEDLRLLGELQTVRGDYEFQGRQFTIQRDGRIVFMGTPEINPRLDIRAQREISGVTASVRIGGLLEAPELELSSQPPMGDAEILSLIVFNQPLSLLGTGAQISLATRATALATGFVASQLTESLGEVLELDLLEIEAETVGGALAPVLTIGEQIGQLYVRLRQRFGPETVSKAIVEYRLADWLRLQTSYAQGDASARNLFQRFEAGGLDLIFFFSY